MILTSSSIVFCSNRDWYLIHCQSRKEASTANVLRNQLGLPVFLPECKTSSRGERRPVPFFPGYLFVQANLQEIPPSRINTCQGVLHLVTFGENPQPVHQKIIDMISEQLQKLNEVCLQPFLPGDQVRVKHDGPLQDLEMIFVEANTPSRRVSVLLNILGRQKKIHLDIDTLEKTPMSQSSRQERLTRGKGRKIKRSEYV